MVTSIVSSVTNIPIRRDVAMTGEVTLTGQVLPIGGLKEKLLAAHRAGVNKVLIPKDNEKDLVDIPQKVKDDIKISLELVKYIWANKKVLVFFSRVQYLIYYLI